MNENPQRYIKCYKITMCSFFQGFSFVAPSVLFNAELFAASAAELCGGAKSKVGNANNILKLNNVSTALYIAHVIRDNHYHV